MTRMIKTAVVAALLGTAPIALAHVTVEPKEAPAGSYAKLVFRVPHGCDGSATTGIHVTIPDGVTAVKPKIHAGWTIAVKKSDQAKPSKDGHGIDTSPTVTEVAWTGGKIPDEFMDEFEVSVKLPEKAVGALPFPVVQDCEKGTARWTEAHGAGHGSGSLPAPTVKVTAAKK